MRAATGCNREAAQNRAPEFLCDVEGCIKERQAESLDLGLEHIQPFSIVITNVSKTVFAQKWVLRIPPCALFQRKNMA
jgi:hypothetical protein